MKALDFLEKLRSRDIQVWAEGNRLRCNAPAGVLTPELRHELRQRKDEILRFLHSAEALAQQQRAIVPLQPRERARRFLQWPGITATFSVFVPSLTIWAPISRFSACNLRASTATVSRWRASRIWPPISPHKSERSGRTARMSSPATAQAERIAFELARQLLRDGAAVGRSRSLRQPFPDLVPPLPPVTSNLQPGGGACGPAHPRTGIDVGGRTSGVYR